MGTSIASVEFFVNGIPSGTATAAPYSITLTNVAANTYGFTAKATDNTGQATTSSAVTVTVSGSAPVYGLSSRPTVGAYLNGQFPPLSSGSFPATLSATGAFTLPFTSITPSSGLVPYVVNTPLWSDNAPEDALDGDSQHRQPVHRQPADWDLRPR